VKIANATVKAEADAISADVDGGPGAGVMRLYDENGAGVPADADTALTTQLLLAEITLNDPSFAAAIDASPGADIVLDVTPALEDPSANNSATATPTLFARIDDSTGTTIIQFDTVLTAGGEVTIPSLAVAEFATVSLTAGTITVPEG